MSISRNAIENTPKTMMKDSDYFIRKEPEELLSFLSHDPPPLTRDTRRGRGSEYKPDVYYYTLPAAFDSEVQSFYEDEEKRAIVYAWTFGIGRYYTLGRSVEEFVRFTADLIRALKLTKSRRLIVYVHNLGYDYAFFRKYYDFDEVFFFDTRDPLMLRTQGIEFRCSLHESNKGLKAVAEDLTTFDLEKLIGKLDYEGSIRSPITPLTDDEKEYCYADVQIMLAYFEEKLQLVGSITRLKLTATGYVRERCRIATLSSQRYKATVQKMLLSTDHDCEEYRLLKRSRVGGFVHASILHSGQVVIVDSYDIASSYPASFVLRYYPMSSGVRVDRTFLLPADNDKLKEYTDRYCCVMQITFHNITAKVPFEHILSKSRCDCQGASVDNGRIISAAYLSTVITEIDFQSIEAFYQWDEAIVDRMYIYMRGRLPTELVKVILQLYSDKQKLKGIEAEKDNYQWCKQLLNSVYGSIITDIDRGTVTYDNTLKTEVAKPADMTTAINKYNKDKYRYLFWPWGVYCTAHSRKRVFDAILDLKEKYVYCDTDSIKGIDIDRAVFDRYNQAILKDIKEAAAFHRLPLSLFMPKDPRGREHPIGFFEYEPDNSGLFKTIGAKRYMVQSDPDNKDTLTITIAGVNKEKGSNFFRKQDNPWATLKSGLTVPADVSGRLVCTYIDDEHDGVIVDRDGVPYPYVTKSGIHMESSGYTITDNPTYDLAVRLAQGLVDESSYRL